MAKKYYAVRQGETPGIYLSWGDCQKNIKGYSGAEYKGFDDIKEAEAFLLDGARTLARTGRDGKAPAEGEPRDAVYVDAAEAYFQDGTANGAVAYVDGSYNVKTREYSCGVVLFYRGVTQYFSRKFSDPERASMRNVAGEIEGSMCAMNYCLEQRIDSLMIYYDYEGIEKWCTGAWKANKEGTIAYRDFYRRASQQVKIRFVKVKGHSGDKYNDLADRLAKQAVGLVPERG